MNDISEAILYQAEQIATYKKRNQIKISDLQTAVRLVLSDNLARRVVSAASRAITALRANPRRA
jgi:hypothetical protein